MEKVVYLVFNDMGYEGKNLLRVFDREYDANLFVEGAQATHTTLKIEQWPIYQHGPQPMESRNLE